MSMYLLGHPTPQVSECRPLCSTNTKNQWRLVGVTYRNNDIRNETNSVKPSVLASNTIEKFNALQVLLLPLKLFFALLSFISLLENSHD